MAADAAMTVGAMGAHANCPRSADTLEVQREKGSRALLKPG